jgi:outer membrane protein assembly factor BamA
VSSKIYWSFLIYFLCWISSGYSQTPKWLDYRVIEEVNTASYLQFPDSIQRDRFLANKLSELHNRGFLASSWKKEFRSDTMSVLVQTGPVFQWARLKLEPVKELFPDFPRKENFLEPAGRLSLGEFQSLARAIVAHAENVGFPFVQVSLDSVVRTGHTVEALMAVNTGPKIVFDSLKVVGSSKIRPSFLHQVLAIRVGDPFSQKKLDDIPVILRNFPFLKLSGPPEITFQNSEATVYLLLDDRSINSLDGIIGLLPNELEGNRMLVTGQFDVRLFNIGGRGTGFSLQWQRFNQFSQSLSLDLSQPHILGSRLSGDFGFDLLKEDTTFLSRTIDVGFSLQVTPSSNMRFYSKRQASDLLATNGLAELTTLPSILDFRLTSYGLSYQFRKLDDPFAPRRGWHTDISMAVGNKVIIENTAIAANLYQGLVLRTLQYQLRGHVEYYHQARAKLTVYNRVAYGAVDNTNLFLNDLFRIGGLQSFRGFNENFFFVSDYIFLNLEPRFYFDRYSYFMIFADVGRFGNRVQRLPVEYPIATGLGFTLETQAGFFNFVYALGLSSTQDFAFNQSKVHLGYTGRF